MDAIKNDLAKRLPYNFENPILQSIHIYNVLIGNTVTIIILLFCFIYLINSYLFKYPRSKDVNSENIVWTKLNESYDQSDRNIKRKIIKYESNIIAKKYSGIFSPSKYRTRILWILFIIFVLSYPIGYIIGKGYKSISGTSRDIPIRLNEYQFAHSYGFLSYDSYIFTQLYRLLVYAIIIYLIYLYFNARLSVKYKYNKTEIYKVLDDKEELEGENITRNNI
jgi:hypothetical protein